jgi:hypothetical protein
MDTNSELSLDDLQIASGGTTIKTVPVRFIQAMEKVSSSVFASVVVPGTGTLKGLSKPPH